MGKQYFRKLNYTLANEDTRLELDLLPEGVGHVCAIAGSGGRALPLLAKRPKRLTCVDLSEEQLKIAELRVESARQLSHEEWLAFWGYPPYPAPPAGREKIFAKIKLPEETGRFWQELFSAYAWESVLYEGKWEQTFVKLSKLNRLITGAKGAGLFDAKKPKAHARYLKDSFPHKRWELVLRLLGNAAVFNALLYKGSFPKKNISASFFEFYKQCFEKLFAQGPARNNFFLQLLFFGEVRFPEGNPVECEPAVFAAVKEGLEQAEVSYRLADVVDEKTSLPAPIDFLSFSDVPSYFGSGLEKRFMQQLKPKLAPNAIVVIRNYLHLPEQCDTTGYENITPQYRELIDNEKVGVYIVDVFRRSA
jgi:S-adenosylmethionine-diacylglycerol 3-amino-3-carboxypropyl transferase